MQISEGRDRLAQGLEGRDRLAQGLEGRDRLAQGLEGRDLREDNAGLADEPLADEPLAAAVAAVLERLIGLFRSLSPASGLSLTAAATLATLERSGPARLTWLAVREGVTQPAMTQLVARLEDAGLAARAADPADGRVVQVRITADGRAMLAGRRAVRAERLAGLLERLSPAEREALSVALPAMDALANAQGGEPVPTAAGVTIGAGR
jgi:DNA-binding MarR family transcriptional regulator